MKLPLRQGNRVRDLTVDELPAPPGHNPNYDHIRHYKIHHSTK